MSGSKTTLAIPNLRASFNGKVIAPDDAEYDKARAIFYGGYDVRPAVILQVADAADVAKAIHLARETGLDLSIRSGGHSSFGVIDDAIVVDVRGLNGLDIDVAGRTVWAGSGLSAAEVTAAVGEHDLVIGFGDTGSVGVGGITLNGGIGFLVRKFGLTIDNLLAAEVVTADGRVLQVDADNNPDLFWAIRGGGGNFGVVTRFKFQLHELPQAVGGMLMLPATTEVISGFLKLAEEAPEELSTIANVMAAPPLPFIPAEHHGKIIVMALITYAGPAEEGEKVLAPFRALATPLADMLRPIKYHEMFPPEDDSYHPTAVADTMFIDAVDDATAGTILKFLTESDAVMRVAQLRVLGGAMAQVAPDATAFAHRQNRIMANLAAFYTTPEDKVVRETWVAEFAAAIRQGDSGGYVGFVNEANKDGAHRAYPEATFARLSELKRLYDPENIFKHNHNVLPA